MSPGSTALDGRKWPAPYSKGFASLPVAFVIGLPTTLLIVAAV